MSRKSLVIQLSVILIFVITLSIGFIFKDSFFPSSKQIPKPTSRLLTQEELTQKVVNHPYTSLTNALKNPDDVYALQLYDQKLTEFPMEILKLKNLQSLNLGKNLIRSIPKDIYKLTLLQELKVFNNQLESLPSEIGRLKYLNELNVSGNKLSSLPDGLQKLTNLRSVDLSENQFTTFPIELRKLTGLEYLDLSSNQLTELPVQIRELKSLVSLTIKNNNLTGFPKEFFQLSRLQYLGLDKQQEEVLQGIIEQEPDQVHPVINGYGFVLGGLIDGNWVQRCIVNKCILKGQKYRLYSFDNYLCDYENNSEVREDGYQAARVDINFEDRNMYRKVTFGVVGDWDALPRKPIVKEDVINKDPFLENYLKSKGIVKPTIIIKKEIIVDLDGDGNDETLMMASNITEKDINEFCDNENKAVRNNKYSLILLRRNTTGKEENIIVAEDYNRLMLHNIAFVADVDNDHTMEFLDHVDSIEAVPAEGFSVTFQNLYKLNQRKAERIGDIFIMPQ